MANARLSPAAGLLRSSRLFSIPRPLSRPASLASDTATQPYPTHAAIETPASSWGRGDWGFKRFLPLKSTKRTGTTTIRVQNGIDSSEHITDFEPASDHVITLKKWQELNMPIRFLHRSSQNEIASVFDSGVDNTSPNAPSHRRWRYDGPWLAGQTGMEFDALLKRVRGRKVEFQRFIRARLDAESSLSKRQEAMDDGRGMNTEENQSATDEEFERHLHYLRSTPTALGPLITEFLDLPEGPDDTYSTTNPNQRFTSGRTNLAADSYRESGPPKTHPSAGISYQRSGAHISNHPVMGPQLLKPALTARYLRPTIKKRAGEVGLAGFVASGDRGAKLAPPATKDWEPVPGGSKLALRPKAAAVDSNGKIRLTAEVAPSSSLAMFEAARERAEKAPAPMRTTWKQMPTLDRDTASQRRAMAAQPYKQKLESLLAQNEDREHL